MAAYRVIDREDNNEDHATVESAARTEQGFLRLFYGRWPTAPRGGFYAWVGTGFAHIYAKQGKHVASFIRAD